MKTTLDYMLRAERADSGFDHKIAAVPKAVRGRILAHWARTEASFTFEDCQRIAADRDRLALAA
jgi:hypothetical protein